MKHIRLYRKNRTNKDIGYVTVGGIFDVFDNHMKSALRINDAEYDFICENAVDSDLELITKESLNYKEKKQLIIFLQMILTKYYASINN